MGLRSSEGVLFALRYGGLALLLIAIWFGARAAAGSVAATGLTVAMLIAVGALGGPF